jgi:hypothetical protein
MLISIAVDLLWLFVYSPLRPIAWDTILSLSRKDQVSMPTLTAPVQFASDQPAEVALMFYDPQRGY